MVRTSGRRHWETWFTIRLGGLVAICMLATSVWFLYGRVSLLEKPHSPHYGTNHCYDCHRGDGGHKGHMECYNCHDMLTRQLLDGAHDRLHQISPSGECLHDLRVPKENGNRPVTALCRSCHKTVTGYVAMTNISDNKYVEVDIAEAHPIGLMPTETIYPRTLPLSKETGAINCITCHDQHASDRRLKMLRYYYPGNGHPADFRPLCNDCHPQGWLPLKLRPRSVQEAPRRD
jgi:hypothetical protein